MRVSSFVCTRLIMFKNFKQSTVKQLYLVKQKYQKFKLTPFEEHASGSGKYGTMGECSI